MLELPCPARTEKRFKPLSRVGFAYPSSLNLRHSGLEAKSQARGDYRQAVLLDFSEAGRVAKKAWLQH
jgi:hypothetical protein